MNNVKLDATHDRFQGFDQLCQHDSRGFNQHRRVIGHVIGKEVAKIIARDVSFFIPFKAHHGQYRAFVIVCVPHACLRAQGKRFGAQ
ncbi:hypothetical protein D3C79_1003740 [compost metagenome]